MQLSSCSAPRDQPYKTPLRSCESATRPPVGVNPAAREKMEGPFTTFASERMDGARPEWKGTSQCFNIGQLARYLCRGAFGKAHYGGCDSMTAAKGIQQTKLVRPIITGAPTTCRPPARQPPVGPPAVGLVCKSIPQRLTIGQSPGTTHTYKKMLGDIPVWKSTDWHVKQGGLALYLFKVATGELVIAYGCESLATTKEVQQAELVAVRSCEEDALATGPHRWKLLDLPEDAVVQNGAGVISWTTAWYRPKRSNKLSWLPWRD